jgi:hypothetical protein
MKLYKIEASNFKTFFGTPEDRIERDVITLAQTPNNDAFLLLSKDAQDGLELLDSVPLGFDFTYCQEWGLTIDDDVVDRVIIDLRKKAYPSSEDQWDMQYHDKKDDTTIWEDTIQAVKEKYPKR